MENTATYDHLITKLVEFGFSKTDAIVYIALLKFGKSSGYKVAKEIGLSRSSVYSSIDNLYNQQYIYLTDSTTKEYSAKAPNILLDELEKRTIDSCSFLKNELNKIFSEEENQEFIFNLTGYDAWLKKVRETFHSAEKEIYLNTDFNLSLFKEELNEVISRGVRVIAFSFKKIEKTHPAIELYCRLNEEETLYPSTRFMMVIDMKKALIFSNSQNHSQGVFTNNELMLKIVAEHIHSDIYLSKQQSIYQTAMTPNILINSIHERVNNLSIYENISNTKTDEEDRP
ncbi:TrmB family transcriptional regulator [Thorsellia anophelis]|uniref:Sugar-specific transcriptional regulator TrmB n=1 Tax=Thorsellia anophelis DSM 18579 TaxID=1123402 RepID=A0A1I0B3P1_9GAMM|nr:TrmB family transcriptional regulator [Thorsellia anophelis]SET01382.1 Sugar-specific transcriptional regulator TrmB [Thorsellia anophelis DSM 18579]